MTTDQTIQLPIVDDPCKTDFGPIHEAALAVTSELALPKVLQKIVQLARDLADAEYAALGTPGPDGTMDQFLVSGTRHPVTADEMPWSMPDNFVHELAKNGQPLRLTDLVEYAAKLDDFEPPALTSFLGVPIISRGQMVGVLYLGNKIGLDEFCESDQQAVEMLAAYAAVAIQNAKLYQKVQQLAVLEERERIGMDLHDGIIQSIFAVGLTLEHGAMLMDEAPEEAHGRIQNAIDGLNQIIRDIRNYILDLRPQRMRPHDLVGSLHRIVEEFRANTLVDISLDMSHGVADDLGEATSTALFLIAQEALANAAKHANATTLSVKIRRVEGRYVTLEVKDNGTGFNALSTEPIIGHGLSNMQLRANAVGGRLQIRSRPEEGTVIKVALPFSSS